MTLILGGASQGGFAHVSDRWLTRSDLRSPQDTDANKTIVVVFYEFMMAIGYTGVAYLGSKPTDQVIAETVADAAFDDRFSHGSFEVASAKMLRLWQTVERMRAGLDARLQRIPTLSAQGFAIDMVGLHFRRGYSVPFAWTLAMQDGGLKLARAGLGGDPGRFGLTAEGSGAPHVMQIWHDLRTEKGAVADLGSLRHRLVEVLRAVSLKAGGTVGPEAMSVIGTIEDARPQLAIELTHFPVGTQAFGITSKASNPAGHSPWVLTPGTVLAPSLVLGNLQMTIGTEAGFEVGVTVKGGPLPSQTAGGRLLNAVRSQARLDPLGQPRAPDLRCTVTPKWMNHLTE